MAHNDTPGRPFPQFPSDHRGKKFQYPDPRVLQCSNPSGALNLRNLGGHLKDYLKMRSFEKKPITIDITSKSKVRLSDNSIILICVLRNAMHDLPQFLKYYRNLGVDIFAIVDDNSDDGSNEFLSEQDDVDLYKSNYGYKDAIRGRVWRDLLVARYGLGRWYVSVDSDEYLVFPDCETVALTDFLQKITRIGIKHVHAPMIDIYPPKDIDPQHFKTGTAEMPTVQCPLFDTDSYWMSRDVRGLAVRGGPRSRLFGQNIRMTKFPLMFVDKRTTFTTRSSHASWPFSRNFTYPGGVLLHNKFAPGFTKRFNRFIEEGNHADGAKFYKNIVDDEAFSDSMAFEYEGSAVYEDSGQLSRLGFFPHI